MGVGAPTTRWVRTAGKRSPTTPSSGLQRAQHGQRLECSVSAMYPTSGKTNPPKFAEGSVTND